VNSTVEAKVKDYLINDLYYHQHDCGTIVECINSLARMEGYDVDERFARAGLGAGPEARIASAIVDRALGGGGAALPEVPEYAIKAEVSRWLRVHPRLGM
jgi:hypothetical protein